MNKKDRILPPIEKNILGPPYPKKEDLRKPVLKDYLIVEEYLGINADEMDEIISYFRLWKKYALRKMEADYEFFDEQFLIRELPDIHSTIMPARYPYLASIRLVLREKKDA